MSLANVSHNRNYHLEMMGKYNSLSWYHWERHNVWLSAFYSWLATRHARKSRAGFYLG